MSVELIVAHDKNNLIGGKRNGSHLLPWKMPSDLAYFKKATQEKNLILGRNTWESLGCRLLPNRHHTVVTSKAKGSDDEQFQKILGKGINPKYRSNIDMIGNGLLKFITLEDLAAYIKKVRYNFMVCGGGLLYEWSLSNLNIDCVYTSVINTEVDTSDLTDLTYFPKLDNKEWKKITCAHFDKGEADDTDFEVCGYVKSKT